MILISPSQQKISIELSSFNIFVCSINYYNCHQDRSYSIFFFWYIKTKKYLNVLKFKKIIEF